MFYYKQFYVCALVGVLIKCLYEVHGATIKRMSNLRCGICRLHCATG